MAKTLLETLEEARDRNQDILDEYNAKGDADDWVRRDFDAIEANALADGQQEMLIKMINILKSVYAQGYPSLGGDVNIETLIIELEYGE